MSTVGLERQLGHKKKLKKGSELKNVIKKVL